MHLIIKKKERREKEVEVEGVKRGGMRGGWEAGVGHREVGRFQSSLNKGVDLCFLYDGLEKQQEHRSFLFPVN